MRTFVVRFGYGTETLLSGCVPDLQLDQLVLKVDVLYLEVDSDGGKVVRSEGVVSETKEKTGLAYTGFADYKKLKEMVVFVIRHFFICYFLFGYILRIKGIFYTYIYLNRTISNTIWYRKFLY